MRTSRRPASAAAAAGDTTPSDPLAAALAEVGDRWTLLVVNALMAGPRRFNDLQSEIAGIATNVLAKRLLQLEQRSLVVATAYSERPPRYSYELTGAGHDLAGTLRLLRRWGAAHRGDPSDAVLPVHADCGSGLEPRWWCPTCDSVVDEDEPPGLRFV
jgi:DNA-binding HxlR family transcriptional regulator